MAGFSTPMARNLLPAITLLALLFPQAFADCLSSCPLTPLDLCDFAFEGHPLDVPTLKIEAGKGDTAISRKIVDRKWNPIEVNESGPGKFECKAMKKPWDLSPSEKALPSDSIPGLPPYSTGSQFYASGDPATVYSRTFQKEPGVEAFSGRCILLPLLALKVKEEGATGGYVNLGTKDGNTEYPEARRCVVFKTWAE